MRQRVPVAPEAHEAYLRGLYRWNQREPDDIRIAIEEYTKAAQLDPRYAAPHAGLAEVYAFMGNFSLIPQPMAYGTARTEAKRALELDPELAEAHSALGVVNTEYEWDWESAEKEYQRALALNPGSAATRQAFADFLSRQGRHAEALRTIQEALRLDPLSPPVNGMLGTVYFHARRYEEAIAQYKRTLEMRREQVLTRFYLGLAYLQTGEHPEAISEFEAAVRYSGGVPLARAGLACAYGMAGKTDEARKIFGQLKALSQTTNVSPSLFALIEIGLGEKERALGYIEQAYQVRDSYLGHLKVAPIVDSLRGEKRFQEILRKLKLSDPSV
jgi:tetratricopeptide (TPR) repeat protein